jgi:3-hydroxyisobutyrate dehydrogenase-like beta-hydroxyacid dehydrogenase
MIKEVGIIGLGKMGLPMARHMRHKGFEVAAYDLSRERMGMAAELGVRTCASPREVAEASDLVIIIVGFDSEVMQVLTASEGIFSGVRRGAVIAVASTCYEETMHGIAALAAKENKDLGVLDMPLCRAERAAEEGTLLLLGGGEQSLFDRCQPVFSTFCTDIEVLGGLGAGQVGKMINNLLLWACISANYEGLKLGAALGLDTERLRQALLKSSGRNWALETWNIHRAMPWAEKDMTIVAHEADRFRLSLPLSGVVKEVIKAIKVEKGFATPVSTGTKP